jgi:TetR/AcrR family transcriptional regulator of autoinduction and epiphytic fitness
VVRRAALAELAAVGWGALTIEGIADRSGVAKSTIYRHWSGKAALIADAVDAGSTQPEPRASGDGVRAQVASLLGHLAGAMADPELSSTVPALVDAAERDPAIAELFQGHNRHRRQRLVDVLRAGVATGELPAHLDPVAAATALAGAVVYRRLMSAEPPDALLTAVLGPS